MVPGEQTVKLLTTLLDIATVFLHVLEAEGRILKRAVMKVGWALAFVEVASFLVLAAAGFFLAGIYQFLAAQMSSEAASLLVSLLVLPPRIGFRGHRKMADR